MNDKIEYYDEPKVYAVKHKNYETRMASRSGGVFTAISDIVLEKRGTIYGCVLTEEFEAVHVAAYSAETRNRMRESKYIQSNMNNVYRMVKDDLEQERWVLFSGTSCQIAGLKSFLGKTYENLLCVDIVCHGVPSLLVWKEYIKWQEERYHGKCIKADFRNKKDYGWGAHVETLWLDAGGERARKVSSEVFKTLFYGHNVLRPCCYQCPYKSVMHPGDITIADYWGIEKAAPGFSDDKGVSLVLVNNTVGTNFFEKAKISVEWKKCKIEDSMQPPLIEPFACPAERDTFWTDFYMGNFESIAKKYGGNGYADRLKKCIKDFLRKIKKLFGQIRSFLYTLKSKRN